MKARVQKWGNSLALRIPKSFAADAQLEQDALVEMSLVDGKLVVCALVRKQASLEQLLAGVTEENRHGEWDMGPAVGGEAW